MKRILATALPVVFLVTGMSAPVAAQAIVAAADHGQAVLQSQTVAAAPILAGTRTRKDKE